MTTLSDTRIEYPAEIDVAKATWARKNGCPRQELHTPCPRTYLGWHEWAEERAKTHTQHRCPGCTLFAIWVERVPVPMPPDLHGMNAGRTMTMQERRRARRRWRRRTARQRVGLDG